MRSILLILSLCLIGCVHSQWSTSDKILAGSFVVGQVLNAGQTREVLNNPDWKELNWHMREVGKDDVYLWKGVSTGIVLLMADQFPNARKAILTLSNVGVWFWVVHDYHVGVKFYW